MASDNQDSNELNDIEPRPSTSDPRTFRTDHAKTNSNQTRFRPNLYKKRGGKSLENRNYVEGNFKKRNNTAKKAKDNNLTEMDLHKPEEMGLKNADSNRKTRNRRPVKKTISKDLQSGKLNSTHDNPQILQPSHQPTENGRSELLNDCNNSQNNRGKNKKIENKTLKKKNLRISKSNTLKIIKELKVVSRDENACDFEKVSDMLTNANISVEYQVLLDFIDLVSKISVNKSTRKLEILQLVFQKKFLDAILTFMQQKTKELSKSDEGKVKCNTFFQKFLTLSSLAIKLLPASSLIFLKHTLVFTKTILCRLEGRIDITHQHFDFQEMANQIEEKAKMEENAREEVSSLDVENMKNMSVLPTVEDLFGKLPELKKNIVEGAYKNIDHYLTVQFTLLHEDFIAPLREGISEFLSPSSKRKTQVAVYRHVQITHASIDSGKFVYVVQLDGNIKWEVITRFFIFGSLLLFTTDHFKSFFTGTVIDVKKENRTIMVKLDTNYFKVCHDIYAEEFVMAVSKVFFEPYYHVLSALQNMASEEFPMKKYIVEVSSETEVPAYINQLELDKYTICERTSVDILNPVWPQFAEVNFNPSQQKAFQAALTNEFVAIQGPPGTGKTFLGLQIVTTLLDNVATDSPILVVCYKNHALDQFLEGILNKTTQIIRIGGRSKNEKLKQFNLKDLRGPYGYQEHDEFLKTLAGSYFRTKYHMDGLRKHGILSVKNLLPYVVSPKLRAELMSISFEDWLMEGVYINKEYERDIGEGVYIDEEYLKDNDGESFDIDQSINGSCSEASKEIVDLECDESNTQLKKHNQGICSNNYLGYKYDDSNDIESIELIQGFEDDNTHDDLFQLNEDIKTRQDPEKINSTTDILDFSEESKKRFDEMYIDDYSKVYGDVAEEIQEELLNNEYECQGKREHSSCSQSLVPYFTLTIRFLKELHWDYESRIQQIVGNEDVEPDEKSYWQSEWETSLEDLTIKISFLKKMLGKKVFLQTNNIEKIYAIGEKFGIWTLSNDQRWMLYHSWVSNLAEDIKKELIKLEESIHFGEQRLDEERKQADLEILRMAKVVGVTTSGAAKNRSTLNKLGANIVVIEEAAEVLESHIVTSLSSKCQHLILIGDHKQLKPNPAVYRLCKKYNFDISLFERMIRNGLSCHTLNVQHRMRPEFASLIVPSIYPHLINHPSTENRPDIAGIHSNLYFIDHNHLEEQLLETESHVNKFEAKFVLQLANYLLLQGYSAEEITILATYSGQVKKIMKIRERIMPTTRDLRISTVDDFQGEENKIIILSLVRSNEEGKIGFLKTENRVCVALSRAREGLYIVGNLECLVGSGQIWPLVKERLLEHNALGQTLSVYCQNHVETVTLVKDGDMFREMPEGGCPLMCDVKLTCGHVCKYHCHPRDQDHRDHYTCSMPCERTCRLEHKCHKSCGEVCGPCIWLVEFDLPCGHKMKAACSSDPDTLKCRTVLPCVLPCGHESTRLCYETEERVAKKTCGSVCDKVMQCGHSCTHICHKGACDLQICQEDVEITCDYEHKVTFKCGKRILGIPDCHEIVEKTLDCGHDHSAPCFHYKNPITCPVVVEKTLACNHNHSAPCFEYKDPIICLVVVEKVLKCDHTQLVACGEPVDNVYCSKTVLREVKRCGHKIWAECSLNESKLACREPCARILKCGHVCKKICYKPCMCSTFVEKELPCGHKVTAKCRSESLPCQQPCESDLACGHKCKGKCGVKCDDEKCQEQVVSKVKPACRHKRVMAPCFLNQMRPAELPLKLVEFCKAKCAAKLPCGHRCEGQCVSCYTSHAHTPCNQPCGVVFPCGHRCPKKCYQNCGVCHQKCLNKCSHRKCDRICGEPCDICQEPCDRRCVHKRCRRPCFAICDRRPCHLPCPALLACGHPCLGFCGERCPPLCLLCNPRHPLAAGGVVNRRLVILEDCGHILNAADMDAFIHRNKSRIVKCPVVSCQTPIVTTKRYHKEVTEAFSNIMKFKRQKEGNSNNVEPSRNQHYNSTPSKGRPYQSNANGFTSRYPHNNGPRTSRAESYNLSQGGAFSRNQLNPTAPREHQIQQPYQSNQNRFTSRYPHNNGPTTSRAESYNLSQGGTFSRNQLNPTDPRGRPYKSIQNGATWRNPHSRSRTASRGRTPLSRGETKVPEGKNRLITPSDIEPLGFHKPQRSNTSDDS